MKIHHGFLIIVLFQTVHRANAGFFSDLFSGKFVLSGLFDTKPSNSDEKPGFVSNVWSTVTAGASKVKDVTWETSGFLIRKGSSVVTAGVGNVASGIKHVVKESPEFFSNVWTSSTTKTKSWFKGYSTSEGNSYSTSKSDSQQSSEAGLFKDSLRYITHKFSSVFGTISERFERKKPSAADDDSYSSESESQQSSNDGFFKDSLCYIRDKINRVFGTLFKSKPKDPPTMFSTDDDSQSEETSFNAFIKSHWSSYTGWFRSAPPGEECTSEWTSGNVYELENRLKNLLYGQHLVIEHVSNIIQHHWHERKSHDKALVLSLHGSTGVGKNYVSKLILESLFKMGDKSKFVTMYTGRLDFTETARVAEYQDRLKNDLVQKARACDRHVFIFDEVERVPKGVFDVLKPFLDYNIKVKDIDFHKAIFIFISNMGQKEINKRYMDLWNDGILRTDLSYSHFEKVLMNGAFNDIGGLKHADIISSHLIDLYIPFLPLEEEHVKQCIGYAFENNHGIEPTEEEIEEVHSYVDYGPEHNPIFSKTGCKAISAKVALVASMRRKKKYSNYDL